MFTVQVVEIKKEMNWDEEERLHWSQVERKLQEQADYSSEEEYGSTVRVVKSRVALPGPSEEEEDLMSGFMVSTGGEEESGYEEREVRGRGSYLHSHCKRKKRKRGEYCRPAKRRKLEAPVGSLWGHVPMFYTPPRPPSHLRLLHSWTFASPYPYPPQLTATPSTPPSRCQSRSRQSFSASPHAVLSSFPKTTFSSPRKSISS